MKALLFLALTLTLASCSSQKIAEQKVEEKANATHVSDSKGLGSTIHEMISTSKDLTEAQKKQLVDIFAKNKATAETLSEQSYKYRATLIKELFSGKMNYKEIKILKKDIKKIEAQRLKNTFDTVEQVTLILSKHPESQKFAEQLIFMDRIR